LAAGPEGLQPSWRHMELRTDIPTHDLITGRALSDEEDGPIRVYIEELLLELGYQAQQITVEAARAIEVEGSPYTAVADLVIDLGAGPLMVLFCRRGSIVTREREAVAVSRLIADPWPPLVVVTNAYDAELLEVENGEVLATGLTAIPDPKRLEELAAGFSPHHPSPGELEQAARVWAAYEVFYCPKHCPA
jgi:hypothetical protein